MSTITRKARDVEAGDRVLWSEDEVVTIAKVLGQQSSLNSGGRRYRSVAWKVEGDDARTLEMFADDNVQVLPGDPATMAAARSELVEGIRGWGILREPVGLGSQYWVELGKAIYGPFETLDAASDELAAEEAATDSELGVVPGRKARQ